ncbi:MAG: LamG-like jellyroll fold domain-containing protein [Halobacteriaceae archaeon]
MADDHSTNDDETGGSSLARRSMLKAAGLAVAAAGGYAGLSALDEGVEPVVAYGYGGAGTTVPAVTTLGEAEPNDARTAAMRVDQGTQVTGDLSGPEVDWYACDFAGGDTVVATFDRGTTDGVSAVVIYGPEGQALNRRYVGTGDAVTVSATADATGTYAVQVVNVNSGGGAYTLTVGTAGGGTTTTQQTTTTTTQQPTTKTTTQQPTTTTTTQQPTTTTTTAGGGPSPVARWALDETSGTTAFDAAGDADGAIRGSPTLGVDGVHGTTAFDFGTADGNYVEVSASVAPTPTSALSFGGWYRTTGGSSQTVLQKATSLTSGEGYAVDVQTGSSLRAHVDVDSGTASVNPWGITTHDDAWHHVFVTWDGASLVMYHDGSEVARDDGQSGDVVHSTTNLYVGRGHNRWSNYYDMEGAVDDVRVYGSALAADDVAAVYDGTAPGGSSGTSGSNTTTTTQQTSTSSSGSTTTTTSGSTKATTTTTTTAQQTTTDANYGVQGYGQLGYGGITN